MMLLIILGVIIQLNLVFANQQNYYENVICGQTIQENFDDEYTNLENLCIFDGIKSTEKFLSILQADNFDYYFAYQVCKYNPNYGSNLCTQKRNRWGHYNEIIFRNSTLLTLALETTSLNQIISFTASDVGLKKINRESFKYFQNLQKLDLSNNWVENLENMIFRFPRELQHLNLSNNKIESIHAGAFDECSPNLQNIDLSFNKLKVFPGTILDALTTESLILSFYRNQIESISEPQVNKSPSLGTLNLARNNFTSFFLKCTKIDNLLLNQNKLVNFTSFPDCKIQNLNLTNNDLIELSIEKSISLSISSNKRLNKLVISDTSEFKTLEARDLNANLITTEMLRNASKLINLDLSDTKMGALNIDTFSDMTNLQNLKLKGTGISQIEHGFFGHQKKLLLLDISDNNLGSIDLHVLISLKQLIHLDISGNNLTSIPRFESLKNIFPRLSTIKIDKNFFNCSYLATIIEYLNGKDIILQISEKSVKNASNIGGVECIKTSNNVKIKPIEDSADEISKKLNEIIEQINNEKAKGEDEKLDFQLMKSQIFHVRNELLEIKAKITENQFNAKISNGSLDVLETRKLFEIMNNFTLEKQKLANEQLLQRINENNLAFEKFKLENERKLDKIQFSNSASIEKSPKSDVSSSTSEILLTVVITSLVFAALIFIYVKFKGKVLVVERNLSVRARSTNTINTTVEIPFNNHSL